MQGQHNSRARMSWRRNMSCAICWSFIKMETGLLGALCYRQAGFFLFMLRQHFTKWNKITDNKRSPTVWCCTFVLGDIFQVGALRLSFQCCINYMDQLSSEYTPSKCHIDHLKGTSGCIPLMSYWSPAGTLHLVSVHRHGSIASCIQVESIIFVRKTEDDESSYRNRR